MANGDLKPCLHAMQGAFGQVFMVGREVVGADHLSAESIKLHSAKGYESMNQVGSKGLANVIAAMWHRGKVPES